MINVFVYSVIKSHFYKQTKKYKSKTKSKLLFVKQGSVSDDHFFSPCMGY